MEAMGKLEVIKAGASLVSQPIQSVVTAIMTTLFLKRNTESTELEKIKAGKFGELIDELLDSGKLSYVEFYKCRNFLRVAKLADAYANEIKGSEFVKEGQFNFEWYMRFFDEVGNISNDDLQELWAKILANEVSRPQGCSLRTLSMIRDMTASEAKLFTSLCRFVLQSGITHFILPYGFHDPSDGYLECRDFMVAQGLHSCIMTMLEIGVLTTTHDLAIPLNKMQSLEMHNEKIFAIIEADSDESSLFRQEAYVLTTGGVELFNIISNMPEYEADTDYALLCFREIKNSNSEMKISAFRILKNGDELDSVSDDLLMH